MKCLCEQIDCPNMFKNDHRDEVKMIGCNYLDNKEQGTHWAIKNDEKDYVKELLNQAPPDPNSVTFSWPPINKSFEEEFNKMCPNIKLLKHVNAVEKL